MIPRCARRILRIAKAERKPVIQPDRVADDLRRESVAAIARCLAAHPSTCATCTLNLTMPILGTLQSMAPEQLDGKEGRRPHGVLEERRPTNRPTLRSE